MHANLFIFIFILGFIKIVTSDPVIKSLVSSVESGKEIEFSWDNVDKEDVDPKIIFWVRDTYPSFNNHTLSESSWKYLNEQSKYRPSTTDKNGKFSMTAPKETGLYNIYYCAESALDGFYCIYQKQIAVISCLNGYQKSQSNIEHIIIFISENHSFDSIYGNYCKGETYSNPTCNYGPFCCEAIPKSLNGVTPIDLTDLANTRFDPCHLKKCEESEINGGKMDKYVIGGIGSDPRNFAAAIDDEFSAKWYFNWARNYAISDRFFQSSAGASSQNDMYFAGGKFFFEDNEYAPQNKNIPGVKCREDFISYYDPTIADLLNTCKVDWTFYGQGLGEKTTVNDCDDRFFDGTDNPFAYFPSLTDSPTGKHNFRDMEEFYNDIKNGTLPSVVYLKAIEKYTEHPGNSGGLIIGQMMSEKVIRAIKNSEKYKNNTLVILVPDESGGFFDHVTPPPTSTVDGQIYGPRTQFLVIGEIAKKNYISHVPLEPSSLIRFIEWNWIGYEGQLYTRDRVVNNIGDLLDSEKAGAEVPSYNRDVSKLESDNIKYGNKVLKFLE